MSIKHIDYFNVGAINPGPSGGDKLSRIPDTVRHQLNTMARLNGMDSTGCEVRFVTPAPFVDVTVSALSANATEPCSLRVLRGNLPQEERALQPGRLYTLRIAPPPAFNTTRDETLNAGGFHSSVWRLMADRGYQLCVHEINTFGYALRPPTKEEIPALTWLAYGSSITHSFFDGYPHVAAQTLKVQVLNKGLGGACHMEPELIDWLVQENTWDFATLELGINMRQHFSPEAFAERTRYTLKQFAGTGKPVLVTNIYPNGLSIDHVQDQTNAATVSESAFNQIVRDTVNDIQAANCYFVEGHEILDDPSCWSADLLHPTAYGHARMGFNLADILRRTLL